MLNKYDQKSGWTFVQLNLKFQLFSIQSGQAFGNFFRILMSLFETTGIIECEEKKKRFSAIR